MPRRKLYKEDIEAILKLKGKKGVSSHSVAKDFELSHTIILNIWDGKYEWKKQSHFFSLKEIKEILALKPKNFDTTKRTMGLSPYKVAKQYGISHTTVYNIWDGKYKSIQKEKDSKKVSFFKKLVNLFVDEDIDRAIKSDSRALSKFQSFTDSLTEDDIKIMQEDLA